MALEAKGWWILIVLLGAWIFPCPAVSGEVALGPSLVEIEWVDPPSGEFEILAASLQKAAGSQPSEHGHRLTFALRIYAEEAVFVEVALMQRDGSGNVTRGQVVGIGEVEPRQEVYVQSVAVSIDEKLLEREGSFELQGAVSRVPCEVYCDTCWVRAQESCDASGGNIVGYDCGCNPGQNHCRWTCRTAE